MLFIQPAASVHDASDVPLRVQQHQIRAPTGKQPADVVDLMERLRASLEGKTGAKTRRSTGTAKAKRKGARKRPAA